MKIVNNLYGTPMLLHRGTHRPYTWMSERTAELRGRVAVDLPEVDALNLAERLKLSVGLGEFRGLMVLRVVGVDEVKHEAGAVLAGVDLNDGVNGAVASGELLADGGCAHVETSKKMESVNHAAYVAKYVMKGGAA